jgi:hypothetical protein
MNRKRIEIQVVAVFSDFFPTDEPKEIGYYLNGIDKESLIKFCVHLLGLKTKNSIYDNPLNFLDMFFRESNKEFKDYITNIIIKKYKKGVRIIIPLSILKILEFALLIDNKSDQSQTLENEEINIFKVILIENEKFSINQIEATRTTTNILPYNNPYRFLSTMFNGFELTNQNFTNSIICQSIKSFYLLEFLQSNEKTKNLYTSLLKNYECKDTIDFLSKLINITTYIYGKKKEGSTILQLDPHDPNHKTLLKFLNNFIINSKDVSSDIDFTIIRSNPLYKISDIEYLPIFDLFIIDLLHKGIYFILDKIYKALPSVERKKIGDFRGFYCKEYFEEQLLYKLLDEIYKKNNITFTGSTMLRVLEKEEPDYYIRNGKYVYLIEAKDILIKKEVKTSFDFNLIEEEFKKKLLFDSNSNSKKAVLQLITSIQKIINNEFIFDGGLNPRKVQIYSIIVVQDHQYNVPGLNYMLNMWFFEELLKLGVENINIEKVKPLTIMDIDTFILYSTYFKKNKVKLHTLIDNYHAKYTKCKIKGTDIKGIIQEQIDEPIPFSLYIDNYFAKVPNFQILPISKLREKLLTLVKK